MTSQQWMIKFKPGTVACDSTGVAQAAREAGVLLDYVRPMSGGACVVRQAAGGDDVARDQERLRQHPAVEWIERDAMKKAW